MIICIIVLIILCLILYCFLNRSTNKTKGGMLRHSVYDKYFNIPEIERSPLHILEHNPHGTVSLIVAVVPKIEFIKLFKPVIFMDNNNAQYVLSKDIIVEGETITKYSVAEMTGWFGDEFIDSPVARSFKHAKLRRVLIDWGNAGAIIADAKKLSKIVDWIEPRNGRIILSTNAYAECADPILKDLYICRLYKNQFGMPYNNRDMSWVNSPEFGLENSWTLLPKYIYDTYNNERLSQNVKDQFLRDWGLTPRTYDFNIRSKMEKEYDNIALLPYLMINGFIKDISVFKDFHIDSEKYKYVIDSIMESINGTKTESLQPIFSTKLSSVMYNYMMDYTYVNHKDFQEFFICLPITRIIVLKGYPLNTSLDTLNEKHRYWIYYELFKRIGEVRLRRIIKCYKDSYIPDIELANIIGGIIDEFEILGIEWDEFIEHAYIRWGNADVAEFPEIPTLRHYDTYLELQVVDYYVPPRPRPRPRPID